MKKYNLLTLFIASNIFMYAQSVVKAPNQYESTWRLKQMIRNQLNTQSRDYAIDYKDIKGSPYENETFNLGEIFINNDNKGQYFLRYNTYKDEVEILKSKQEDQAPIFDTLLNRENLKVVIGNNTFNTFNYADESNIPKIGWFLDLNVTGAYKLYAKKRTVLTPAVKATSPNESGRAARFTTYADYYILKNNTDELELISTKKKAFFKYFNKYSRQIKTFIKKEKLKIKKEADLVKVISYINTLYN